MLIARRYIVFPFLKFSSLIEHLAVSPSLNRRSLVSLSALCQWLSLLMPHLGAPPGGDLTCAVPNTLCGIVPLTRPHLPKHHLVSPSLNRRSLVYLGALY